MKTKKSYEAMTEQFLQSHGLRRVYVFSSEGQSPVMCQVTLARRKELFRQEKLCTTDGRPIRELHD